MTSQDRRRSPRVEVDLPVVMARTVGGPVRARTIDLSTGGMQIATARPLRIDEVLDFNLALDPEHELGGRARVMRLHPRNHYALRFERLEPVDLEEITRFVTTH
jgi:c-di-GMP-binding flagellar brake protein YcgR